MKNKTLFIIFATIAFIVGGNVYAAEITTCNYKDANNNTITVTINKDSGTIDATSNWVNKCIGKSFVSGENLQLSYDSYVDYSTTNLAINCKNIPKLYSTVPTEDYSDCKIDVMGSSSQSEFTLQENTSSTVINNDIKSCVYKIRDGNGTELQILEDTYDDVSKYTNLYTTNYGKYVVITVDMNKKVITSNNVADVLGTGSKLDGINYSNLIEANGKCKATLFIKDSINGGTVTEEEKGTPRVTVDWGDEVDVNCNGIIGTELIELLRTIFNWIKIVAPILVVVLGSVDFAGALLKDDKDALSKALGKFVKRLIVAIALFFIPTILNFLFDVYYSVRGIDITTCL